MPQGVLVENLQDFYEDAPCGYLSWRIEDGALLRANRTLLRWIGPWEAIKGAGRFRDLLTPPGRIMHETRHTPRLRAGGAVEAVALELACADGQRLPVLAHSQLLADGPDGGSVVRTSLFDATVYRRYEEGLVAARRRAEQAEAEARRALVAAEAAARAKTGFLAAMNHEFRTPIGIVSGFTGLLRAEAEAGGPGAARLDWLRDVEAASEHLLVLLEDATLFARLDDMARRMVVRPVALRRLVDSAMVLAAPVLQRLGIHASAPDVEGAPSLRADPALAAEALACGLREMARMAPQGAHILIENAFEGGLASIRLTCPKLEMGEAALADLRAPLAPSALLSRGLQGSGLAIAVAQRIAELHQGSLRIEAPPLGGLMLALDLPQES
ncbi:MULTISPECIES: sensor histidine kinase [Roseomonadaceae]|nr:HAMP domain-containing sensor histidine kinase [Roseomonas oleicola]